MSQALEQLKTDLDAVIANVTAELDDDTKQKLAESIERSAVHVSVGNDAALKVEANTVATLLWTDNNERGKKARQELVNAVSRALVKGLIAAL